MPGEAAAVGAVATLVDDLVRYVAIDPDGWARMTVERKLEALHEAGLRAFAERNYAAVDRCTAEYRRLHVVTA